MTNMRAFLSLTSVNDKYARINVIDWWSMTDMRAYLSLTGVIDRFHTTMGYIKINFYSSQISALWINWPSLKVRAGQRAEPLSGKFRNCFLFVPGNPIRGFNSQILQALKKNFRGMYDFFCKKYVLVFFCTS